MERSTAKLDPRECSRFEELLAAMRIRELTEEEWTFYLEHEDACQLEHAASTLEEALELEQGALEAGDSRKGLLSARELEEQTLKLIQVLRSQDEGTPAATPCPVAMRGQEESSRALLVRLWSVQEPCGLTVADEIEHFMPQIKSWRTRWESRGDQYSAERQLWVIWDRMPNTQEIPALRRMLELSLAEFWMVLVTYWHSSEAGARLSSHQRLRDDWEVLFWRDAFHSSRWRGNWPSAHGCVLEGLRQRLTHQCAYSRKRAVRIVAPVEGSTSGGLTASGANRETQFTAAKCVKGEEAQIVRLDELLEQFRRSPSPSESGGRDWS